MLCRRSWSIVSARCLILAGWCFGVQFCSRPACRFSSQQDWIDSAFVYPLVHRAFIYRLRSADAFGACSCRHSACEVLCAAVHSSGIIVTAVAIPAAWPAVVDPALLRYCSYIARLLAVGAVSRSRPLGRAATCPCCAKLHICASTARGWPLLPSLSMLLVSRLECAVLFRARLRFGVCSLLRSAYRSWRSRYLPVCPAYPESDDTREPWSVFVHPALASASSLASAPAMPALLESRECEAAVSSAPAVAPPSRVRSRRPPFQWQRRSYRQAMVRMSSWRLRLLCPAAFGSSCLRPACLVLDFTRCLEVPRQRWYGLVAGRCVRLRALRTSRSPRCWSPRFPARRPGTL